MNYEKKYKEALERAKEKYTKCYSPALLDYIFPELKSEDVEIRRSIIRNLKRYIKCIKDGYDASSAKDFVVKEIEKQIAWLEKQGKLPIPKLRDINEVVEPKFHEGDWVIYNNDICQIVKREEGCNILVTQFGVEKEPVNERNLSTAKLWDISDAKDGDVLVNGSNIFIFHFINGTRLMGYCHVNIDNGRFYDDIGKNECFCLIDAVINPATKEQRDLLFQKMKEAGYIFDFKNKELKKIKNDIEIPFGAKDSELQEATYFIPKGFYAEIDDDKVVIKKGEKPAAWSKKDEKMFKYALNMIEWYSGKNEDKSRYVSDWLKSLKQRIGG